MDYGSKEMMRRVQEVSEGEKDIYIYIKGGGGGNKKVIDPWYNPPVGRTRESFRPLRSKSSGVGGLDREEGVLKDRTQYCIGTHISAYHRHISSMNIGE